MRKDFTISESVAIAKALEDEMGNRQGQRTDIQKKQLPNLVSEVPKNKETRNIVAQKAGLGCGRTYQQAKQVVDLGTQELKDAMDKDVISIRNAAVLANLPAEEQKRIITLHPFD